MRGGVLFRCSSLKPGGSSRSPGQEMALLTSRARGPNMTDTARCGKHESQRNAAKMCWAPRPGCWATRVSPAVRNVGKALTFAYNSDMLLGRLP